MQGVRTEGSAKGNPKVNLRRLMDGRSLCRSAADLLGTVKVVHSVVLALLIAGKENHLLHVFRTCQDLLEIQDVLCLACSQSQFRGGFDALWLSRHVQSQDGIESLNICDPESYCAEGTDSRLHLKGMILN